MKGLPVEDRNTKLTPKLKSMLRDRVDKINDFVTRQTQESPQNLALAVQPRNLMSGSTARPSVQSPASSFLKSGEISARPQTTASKTSRKISRN